MRLDPMPGADKPACPLCGHRTRAAKPRARRRELRRAKRRSEQQWRTDWRNTRL
jgi:hypothetical protein